MKNIILTIILLSMIFWITTSRAGEYLILDTITITPSYDVEIPVYKNVIDYNFENGYFHIKQLDTTNHYISTDVILRMEIKPNAK